MKRNAIVTIAAAAVLLVAGTASTATAAEPWLHVHVEGASPEDQVRVNVPLSLVSTLLTSTETEGMRDGRLRIDDHDLDGVDLRSMLAAVRDAEDAEFVRVRDPENDVRVAKEGGRLLVRIEPREPGNDRVRVQVPMRVVEALLEDVDASGELNLAAAIEVLGTLRGEDLVLVESDDERVRIWIDDRDSMDP